MGKHGVHGNTKRHVVEKMEYSAGEEVTWTCDDSDFRIWFPPEHDPLEPGPDTSTKGTLTRKLKAGLPHGEEFEYGMYCFKDKRLVEGNSPPIMIIR